MVVAQLKLILGLIAPTEQYSPADLVKYGIRAEKSELDSVWVSDHFHPWFHTNGHGAFGWEVLSAIGALTKKVILGTSITCPLFRYPPAIVAQAFATAALLFPGRIFLGVGTGEALNEIPCGFEWPSSHRERLERLKEALVIIRMLWTRDFVTYSGKYYRVLKANLYDKPLTPIPVHVASTGPKGAELAGSIGDAFMTLSTETPSAITENLFPALEKGAKSVGRKPEQVEKSLMVNVGFHEGDYKKALDSLYAWRANLLPVFFDLGVSDPRYIEAHGQQVSDKAVEKKYLVATSEEDIIRFYEKYIKIGFSHIAAIANGDVEGFARVLGEKVAPYLRERYHERNSELLPYTGTYNEENLKQLLQK